MPSLADVPAPDSAAADPASLAPEAASTPETAAPPGLPSPFADVAAGSIPAVIVPPIPSHGKPDPVQQFTADNFDTLLKAGLDYHETKSEAVVLFNPKSISAEKVAAADKAGKLDEIAQPVTELGSPAAAEVPVEAAPAPEAAPAAPAGALAGAPPPAAVSPVTAAAQRDMVAPRQVSPIQPNPVPGRLAKRAA